MLSVIAQTVGLPSESISDEAHLADIAPDSIALFELLVCFENVLGTTVRYEDIAAIETVGDVIAYAEHLPQEVINAALERTASTAI